MLDPMKRLTVAEAVSSDKASNLLLERRRARELGSCDGGEDVTAESWRVLDWSLRFLKTAEPSLIAASSSSSSSSSSRQPCFVLGFAIWMVREPMVTTNQPVTLPRPVVATPRMSWLAWTEILLIKLELWAWRLVYRRKDQDVTDDPIYDAAEEELTRTHYSTEACYYLDNLTVDFQAHGLGIGHQLLNEGLEEANRMGLGVSTEASAAGERLYRKAGFKQVGVWQIEDIVMPVMKWTGSAV